MATERLVGGAKRAEHVARVVRCLEELDVPQLPFDLSTIDVARRTRYATHFLPRLERENTAATFVCKESKTFNRHNIPFSFPSSFKPYVYSIARKCIEFHRERWKLAFALVLPKNTKTVFDFLVT